MDPTSTTGDFASEKLQRVPSAASLNPAEPHIQATKVQFQPVQHGGNREDEQTRDSAEHDVDPDSLEAAVAGAQENTQEDRHSPINDIRDDVSICSDDLIEERLFGRTDFRLEESEHWSKRSKKKGTKYARVAALYTEGLESRVGTLERDLLELQYEVGAKEKPSEER